MWLLSFFFLHHIIVTCYRKSSPAIWLIDFLLKALCKIHFWQEIVWHSERRSGSGMFTANGVRRKRRETRRRSKLKHQSGQLLAFTHWSPEWPSLFTTSDFLSVRCLHLKWERALQSLWWWLKAKKRLIIRQMVRQKKYSSCKK